MPQDNPNTGQLAGTDAPETIATTTTEISETGNRISESQAADQRQESHSPTEAEVAEHLNLPADVLKQIAAKGTEPEVRDQQPAAEEQKATEEIPAESGQRTAESGEEETETDEGEEQEQRTGVRSDKAQKRIDRLTKKFRESEKLVEALKAELAEKAGTAGQKSEQETAGPRGSGALANVRSESQLDQIEAEAETALDWCDDFLAKNPEGAMIGEGDKARFIEPKEIAGHRRMAEKVLRGTPIRREQLRKFNNERGQFDQVARTEFPEVFDKGTKEYQAAQAILGELPMLKEHPAMNFALGVMLEGYRSLNAKKAGKTKSGNQETRNGDLDERLDPEYQRKHIPPTAPATAKPPSRAIAPSHLKRVEQAAESFTRAGGGNVGNLKEVIEALDEDTTRNGRRPVEV